MSVTTHDRPVNERLLTVAEVAELLQVKESWLYVACKRGEFPHVKVGRYVRFSEQQVREWVASGGSDG